MKREAKASRMVIAGTGQEGPLAPSDLPLEVDGASHEVALHEFGQAVADAVAAVHEELARYPNSLGAYVVDEVEVTVPVVMRVNDVGQPLVKIVDHASTTANTAQIRLRVRPVLGSCQPLPVASTLPLSVLHVLPPPAIAALAARRIFSVEDLQRVARSPGGPTALENLNLGAPLEEVFSRAAVLSLPIPPIVAESLIAAGVKTAQDFVRTPPEQLLRALNPRMPQPITVDHIRMWQETSGAALTIPMPPRPRPEVQILAPDPHAPIVDSSPAPTPSAVLDRDIPRLGRIGSRVHPAKPHVRGANLKRRTPSRRSMAKRDH